VTGLARATEATLGDWMAVGRRYAWLSPVRDQGFTDLGALTQHQTPNACSSVSNDCHRGMWVNSLGALGGDARSGNPCGLSVITSLLVCDSLTTCVHLSFNDLDHLLIVMLTGTVRLD
jgi:hypothetical protein